MTYDRTQDRDYWRREDDRRLIEAAQDSQHELCIALGERLADLVADADLHADTLAERNELDKRCDALRAELNELHAALNDMLTEYDSASRKAAS